MDDKVCVISTTDAEVSLILPQYRFSRTWSKKGTKIFINNEILQEAMFEPGVEYLFKQGLLYIEDMEVKKELNLEDPEAEEPTNIIVLTDKQIERLLTKAPVVELKSTLKKISKEQMNEFVQRAIAMGDISIERSEIIKEAAKKQYRMDVDIAKSIMLHKQAVEPFTENEDK